MSTVVAGLSFRVLRSEQAEAELAGPALVTAAGFTSSCGQPVTLIMPVAGAPGSAELDTIRRASGGAGPHHLVAKPPPWLTLACDSMRGDRSGRADLRGDVVGWSRGWSRAQLPRPALLVLSNGDPAAQLELARRIQAERVIMDVHGDWIASRGAELCSLMSLCELVTINRRDQAALESGLNGATVVVKDGERGVVVRGPRQESSALGPPCVAPPFTDVGAGDFLLGALAAKLRAGPITVDSVSTAYEQCLPALAQYMGAGTLGSFLRGAVGRDS